MKHAVEALASLAHGSRLAAFRLLVRAGPAGVPAGEVAVHLDAPASTTSFHLSQLARAGLVDSRRVGRSIVYSLSVERVRELLDFLTRDCCQGRPELCAPRVDGVLDCGACDE